MKIEETKNSDDSKNEVEHDDMFFRICNTILRFEVERGHLKWRITDVARCAEVTRSLIYYYFGKSKEEIVEEAYRFMIEFITAPGESKSIEDRVVENIQLVKDLPYLFILFFLERSKDSRLGEMIRKGEEHVLDRISKENPKLTPIQVKKYYIVELGAAVYQHLDRNDVEGLFA